MKQGWLRSLTYGSVRSRRWSWSGRTRAGVDSAGINMHLSAGRASEDTGRRPIAGSIGRRIRSLARVARRRSIALRRCNVWVASTPRSARITKTWTWLFVSGGAGYDCVFEPQSRILHDLSASYDHARPNLQERMSRNAEVLFWSNLPAGWLILAAVPHVGFTLAQAVYRLLRGRHRPYLRGKLAAARQWGSLASKRQLRVDLARTAAYRPRFPIRVGIWEDVLNHSEGPPSQTGSVDRGRCRREFRSVILIVLPNRLWFHDRRRSGRCRVRDQFDASPEFSDS